MTGKLGVVLVGVGRMGRFHLDQLASSPAVEVLAVVDASEPALAAATAAHPGMGAFTDLATALAHPGVEACVVATSTPTHASIVDQALEAGRHVLVEKPLDLDPEVSRRLGALAAAQGLVLQVGFWRRFSPPWSAAKDAIASDRIGRPVLLRLAQWDADPPPPQFCDPRVSGGLAVDCGVHEIDLAEWLTGGRIDRVSAWTMPLVEPALEPVGDVDNLVAVLRLTDGTAATVELSRNCRYGDDVRTEVLGSDGALFVDTLPVARTRLATRGGWDVLAGSEADDAMGAGVRAQAESFARATRGAILPLPGAEESARATEVARAVQRSASEGREVSVVAVGGRT